MPLKDETVITAEILLDLKCINFSPKKQFKLTSGKKSPIYCDCRRLISFPKEMKTITNLAVKKIKSLNNLKNDIEFEACIIGKGKLKKKLQGYINFNNLRKYVRIIDYVDNPYPFIKQTNLFVLSSKFEGLPNVLLESLVLKKFVISSNCPTGPSEILKNGKSDNRTKTRVKKTKRPKRKQT